MPVALRTKSASMGVLLLAGVTVLAGCRSAPPVPVVDRQIGSAAKTDNTGPVYVVKKGDTLYSISLDNGQYYRDVQAWNNIENPNVIQVGQTLRLTPPGTTAVKTNAVTGPAMVQTQPIVEQKPLGPASPSKTNAPNPNAKPAVMPAANPVAPATPSTPTTAADALPAWSWPAKGKVVGAFGDGAGGKGIDIAGNAGDPVLAAGEGKVVYVGSGLRGYGQMVIVKHENNYLTAYAHNRKLLVTEGQNVRQGQKIAEMGDSDTDRVKLHFEVRKQGKPVDPALYLPKK